MPETTVKYTIEEHIHRFGCWAASRAAQGRVSGLTVEKGRKCIEYLHLENYINKPESLPDDFDSKHREWRNE